MHVLIQLLVGFNAYLPAGTMIGNIQLNKVQSVEMILRDIQCCALLHAATNLTYLLC